jgi:hypothetical protein
MVFFLPVQDPCTEEEEDVARSKLGTSQQETAVLPCLRYDIVIAFLLSHSNPHLFHALVLQK